MKGYLLTGIAVLLLLIKFTVEHHTTSDYVRQALRRGEVHCVLLV